MKSWLLVLFAGITCAVTGCKSRTAPAPQAVEEKTELRVVDIRIVGADKVAIGTNLLSISATTNYLSSRQADIDLALFHGGGKTNAPDHGNSRLLSEVLSMGIPLLIVDADGEATWRNESGNGGIRTVKLDSDKLSAFQSSRNKNRKAGILESAPPTKTTVQWDSETGNYELQRVEVGIFGRKVWLVHEEPHDEKEAGSVGIRFKKDF